MIKQGQVLSMDNLNRAFVSKTATGTQILLGSLNLSGNVTATTFIGAHSGDGSTLTNLNGTNIALGTVADARLSANVDLLNAAQTMTAYKSFSVGTATYLTTYTDPASGVSKAIKFSGGIAGDTALFNGDVTIGGKINGSGQAWFSYGSTTSIIGYSWTGAAVTTNSIEIVNNQDAVTNLSPTLVFHRYGSGGPQFRLDATGTNVLYLESANANSSRDPRAYGGAANQYFAKLYIDGGLDVTGATNLTGTVTTTNGLIVGTNLDVRGQMLHGIQNEFPDPLLASGDIGLWASGGGAVTFDSVQSPVGTNTYGSFKVTTSTTGIGVAYGYYFDVSPSEWITFSTYIFATTAGALSELHISWYDASKVSIPSANYAFTAPTSWGRYNVTGQAPANARYFQVAVDNDNATAVIYFSAFQVERGRAMTGFKPYFGGGWTGSGVTTVPEIGGGVNILGLYPSTAYGAGSLNLSNASDGTVVNTWGRITSKDNYGIALRYNSGDIIIGGTQTGTYTSKVAIGGTVAPAATLEVQGNQGATNNTNFKVWYGPNNGLLASTEFHALRNDGTNWTAMYAKQGAATYAGVFDGAVQVNSNNLTLNGGALMLSDIAGAGKTTIRSAGSGTYLWIISGTTVSTTNFGTAYDNDKQVALSYTPGTVGAFAGILNIGQIAKNNANYTHGITAFYTNGAERMRIDSSGKVGMLGVIAPAISLAIGDTDTGLNWTADGAIQLYSNNVSMIAVSGGNAIALNSATTVNGNLTVTGTLSPAAFNPASITINNKYIMQYNATEDSLDFVYV